VYALSNNYQNWGKSPKGKAHSPTGVGNQGSTKGTNSHRQNLSAVQCIKKYNLINKMRPNLAQKIMQAELIRALTPPFLAACGVAVFAIAVAGKVDNNAFNQVSNIVSACLGGAAGASMHSSG
jgi:hypothetical protein